MNKYGIYLGGQRALDAWAVAHGRAMDMPLAGVLGEGTHLARITSVQNLGDRIFLTFQALNGTGTHLEIVATNNVEHLQAVVAASQKDVDSLVGSSLLVTLAYSDGYRVIHCIDGYRASVPTPGGTHTTSPFDRLTDLEAEAVLQGLTPAKLEVTEYDAGV